MLTILKVWKVKVFFALIVLLFGTIGIVGWMKKAPRTPPKEVVQEISLGTSEAPLPIPAAPPSPTALPEVDRLAMLFDLRGEKLPIVETVSFTSRVPWLKERPAWVADYATHYQTSRHFIARSLNGTSDYFSQKVSPGDRFNVFKKGINLRFHLLVDLSRCKMWLYYFDQDNQERVLLKTYTVGVGKKESSRPSGYFTPIGKYELGEKIAIYKPGVMSFFQEAKTEMIRVFGTRWLPFEKELEGCSEPAKGYGLHGAPWITGPNGQLVEDVSKIGKYDSDGCIRLRAEDIEEIFAIVITKPTTVEIVKDFHDAKLPGRERSFP
jgi:hypothetical protein